MSTGALFSNHRHVRNGFFRKIFVRLSCCCSLIPAIVSVIAGFAAAPLPGNAGFASPNTLFSISREDAQAAIQQYMLELAKHLDRNKLSDARRTLELIEVKLEQYKDVLARSQRKAYKRRVKAHSETISLKTDSLVSENLRVLEQDGADAAIAYRRRLISENGVSQMELASVDEAIVLYGPSARERKAAQAGNRKEKAIAPASRPKPEPAHASFVDDSNRGASEHTRTGQAELDEPEPNEPSTRRESRAAALERELRARREQEEARERKRLKAQIDAERERLNQASADERSRQGQTEKLKMRNKAAENAGRIEELLAEGSIEEAKTVFGIYREQLRRNLDAGLFGILEERVTNAYRTVRQNREQAARIAADIFDLIEQKRGASAQALFDRNQKLLIARLDRDIFSDLKRKVERSYSSFARHRSRANKTADKISRLLDKRETEQAYQAFSRAEQTLERFLDQAAFEVLRSDVQRAYEAMQNRRKSALLFAREIRRLIKKDLGAEAHKRFKARESDLEKNLDQKDFNSLSRDVSRANEEFLRGSERAGEVAAEIRKGIRQERIEEAHRKFQRSKKHLRRYLRQPVFDTLRTEVRDSYASWTVGRRRSSQISRSIRTLIKRREGDQAYQLFEKEKGLLHRYLGSQDFSGLRDAVTQARADYRAGRKEAQAIARAVENLLKRDKPDEANERFKNSQDELRHYLEQDNAYDSLQSAVTQAYRELQRSRRKASQEARAIHRLVQRTEGQEAYDRFVQTKGHLSEFLDKREFKELTASVSAARKEYRNEQANAKQSAARIEKLLASKKVSNAYEMFEAAHADLRKYLDQKRYDTLHDKIDQAYSTLKDKRRTAFGIVRDINGLIDQQEGAKAYALFRKQRSKLRKHMSNEAYRELSSNVSEAHSAYRTNVREAVTVAAKIRSLAGRDSIAVAYSLFKQQRGFLDHYLYPKQFSDLKNAVEKPYASMQTERRKAKRLVAKINWMLWRRRVGQAYAEFTENKSWLRDYLPPDGYEKISVKVLDAHKSSQQSRRDAAANARRIRSYLGQRKIDDAWSLYKAERNAMKRHLGEQEYKKLERKTRAAYEELSENRKKAQSFARKLKGMIRRDKAWDAYKSFRKNRRDLRKYLEKEAYASLEKEITDAYRNARNE